MFVKHVAPYALIVLWNTDPILQGGIFNIRDMHRLWYEYDTNLREMDGEIKTSRGAMFTYAFSLITTQLCYCYDCAFLCFS